MSAGLRRVHVLAWRDLDDPDAGGSEVHADEFMRRWAAAGLDITHRTSAAVGQPAMADRNGYHVVRRGSRYSVFPRAVGSEWVTRDGSLRRPRRGVERRAVDEPAVVPQAAHHLPPSRARADVGPTAAHAVRRHRAGARSAAGAALLPARALTLTPSDATRVRSARASASAPTEWSPSTTASTRCSGPAAPRCATPLVVCVGRLAPVKRQAELIEAARRRPSACARLQLTIVGDGPLRPSLEARIAAHGAQEWITLVGRLRHAELRRGVPAGVVGRQRLTGRGVGADDHRGSGVRHTRSCHRCQRSSQQHRRRSDRRVAHRSTPWASTMADVLLDDDAAPAREAALARSPDLTWDASAPRHPGSTPRPSSSPPPRSGRRRRAELVHGSGVGAQIEALWRRVSGGAAWWRAFRSTEPTLLGDRAVL